jgi:NADPH:quinone reductase-like Zn-dependent oxidoreductase
MATGKLKVKISRTFPLTATGAAEAHRVMAERGTVGKLVLLP